MSEAIKQGDDEAVTISYAVLTRLLSFALVEISGTDDLRIAHSVADVFHNLPEALASGTKSADDIFAEVYGRAKRHGVEKKVSSLLKTAAGRE